VPQSSPPQRTCPFAWNPTKSPAPFAQQSFPTVDPQAPLHSQTFFRQVARVPRPPFFLGVAFSLVARSRAVSGPIQLKMTPHFESFPHRSFWPFPVSGSFADLRASQVSFVHVLGVVHLVPGSPPPVRVEHSFMFFPPFEN